MATYIELKTLFSYSDLQDKVEVACIVAAETIRAENSSVDNHANRLIWAKKAFASPMTVRNEMLAALLAANKDQDVGNIIGASDTAIQTKVDAAVDVFADGN